MLRRPSSLRLAAGTIAFDYDIRGRRVLKAAIDEARLYLRGRAGRALEEHVRAASSPGTDTTIQYLYGPSGLVGLRTNGQYRTLLRDHIGSIRAVVDQSKNVVAAYHYLPFGALIEPAFETVPDAVRYLFAGQELDPESGLYNMGARLYDPVLGRFYATDPVSQLTSPYVYANNNPISMVDPTGEFSIAAFFIGALLAIVGIAAIIVTAGADAAAVAPLVGMAEAAEWSATAVGAVQYGTMAAGAVAGSTSLSTGVSSIQYSATHNGLNGSEYGEALASGAISGAVSGAVNFGITAISSVFVDAAISGIANRLVRAGVNALRSGLESATSSLPGQAVANVATKQKADSGLLDSFLIGFGTGALTGAFTAPTPKPAHVEAGGHLDANVAADPHEGLDEGARGPERSWANGGRPGTEGWSQCAGREPRPRRMAAEPVRACACASASRFRQSTPLHGPPAGACVPAFPCDRATALHRSSEAHGLERSRWSFHVHRSFGFQPAASGRVGINRTPGPTVVRERLRQLLTPERTSRRAPR